MKTEKEKYYVVKNKALACAIAFVTNEKYFTYDNINDSSKKVYSFRKTKKFDYAMKKINELLKEINNIS